MIGYETTGIFRTKIKKYEGNNKKWWCVRENENDGEKKEKKKKRIWKQTNKTGEKKTEEEVEEKRKGMNRLEEGRKKVSFSCKTAPYID